MSVYTIYHGAFSANQSRVPASLLNAFNAHLTTPCLLNVSPSTLRPHALLPRPNCRGFDWPRELVSPNSCAGWQLGCISLRKGSQRIQIILDILVLLRDSLNGLMCWDLFSAGFWGLFMTWTEFVMHKKDDFSLKSTANCDQLWMCSCRINSEHPGITLGLRWVSMTKRRKYIIDTYYIRHVCPQAGASVVHFGSQEALQLLSHWPRALCEANSC